MTTIVLASSSPYRQTLLKKLITNFICASPDIDESKKDGESFQELSLRLSREKALALKDAYPNALIIGSDQVAVVDEKQLSKPGTLERNIEQLKDSRGKTVRFFTSVSLLNSQTGNIRSAVDLTQVKFRQLSDEQIEAYTSRESAIDCAGGFKMEGLGIALFEAISGDDPNALIGLPLIKLTELFEQEGFDVLTADFAG